MFTVHTNKTKCLPACQVSPKSSENFLRYSLHKKQNRQAYIQTKDIYLNNNSVNCTKFGQSVLGNIIKIVAISCHMYSKANLQPIGFFQGLCPSSVGKLTALLTGVYPATPQGGELSLKQIYSPPRRRTINSPVRGSTCFNDQLTCPLHANLLLQHETEDIHAMMLLKITRKLCYSKDDRAMRAI